ncbi:MAG: DEAD/DEAH box helicase, partial [Steroidobacteraceae bacterium]
DILVATPGRMLDMGFIHDIKRVMKLLPAKRQNLMFSATYNDDIRSLAQRLLRNPEAIEVAPRNAAAARVQHQAYRVQQSDKRHLLVHLIKGGEWNQMLVFTRTKHGANRLTKQLVDAGIRADAIHGNKSQAARTRALAEFKQGRSTALVATEVAARGLDIKELPCVVNYELPNVPEDYVHRIGRTARAGAGGAAISLVSPDEGGLARGIERLLGHSIPVTELPKFDRPPSPSPVHASAHHPQAPSHGQPRRSARGFSRAGSSDRTAYGSHRGRRGR